MHGDDGPPRDEPAERAGARRGLGYAQIQQCRRGEYDAVARTVLQRARKGLWVNVACLLAILALTPLFGLFAWMPIAQIVLTALVAAYQFVQARRTAETVHRLMEERDRLPPEGPAD
jgi:hypothetical protein